MRTLSRRTLGLILAAHIGTTEAHPSRLKSGKGTGIRFETLAKICAALDCQPGDRLEAPVSVG